MAWERRGVGLYYYSSTRRDGKVVKAYHGQGLVGRLAADAFDRARQRRADRASALAAERARLAPIEEAMAALDRACRLMTRASLVAGGYYESCGHWRRRRGRRAEAGELDRHPG